jgi:branched-chain amino acid transport system substrate-binding protein
MIKTLKMLATTVATTLATTAAMMVSLATTSVAQDTIKIGLILPMTGPFTSTGKQISAAANLYIEKMGATVAGKKIELILKDDTGVADVTKRIAQELIVNDKVTVIAGFGLTPLALATAPLATQAKTPMVVMAAATSIITERSPFVVRTSQVVPQIAGPFGTWAAQQGMKKVVTIVSDFGPGHDVENSFSETFKAAGGQVENIRVPLQNPDFSPFLQRVADSKPDALLVFVPSGVGAQFMKQFVERGMDKSGIRLIGTGDVTDDDILNGMGDSALGISLFGRARQS